MINIVDFNDKMCAITKTLLLVMVSEIIIHE